MRALAGKVSLHLEVAMAFKNWFGAALLGAGVLVACGSEDDSGLGGTDGSAGSSSGGSAGSAGSAAGSAGQAGSAGNAGSGAGGSAGAECTSTHANTEAGAPACAPGECRCQTTNLCYPREQAARCCEGELRCFTEDGGVDCEGRHPEVDGGTRFCKSGDCYCEANDTCFPAKTATLCCGPSAKCG
jgi:hypothetical protein